MKGLSKSLLLLLLLLPTTTFASEQPAATTQADSKVSLIEYPTGILPILREFQPALNLIYLSGDPLLRPTPEPLNAEITQLIKSDTGGDFTRKGSPRRADLLILPVQTVRVALQHGLIKQATWVPPAQTPEEIIPLEAFRQKLAANNSLTADEAQSFRTLNGNSLSGEIDTRPFRVTTIHNLPTIDTPSVLLIDLSFFLPLYQDEIKTPIFPLVHSILNKLLSNNPGIEKIVISSSTGFGDVPLKFRFLGPALKALASNPNRMSKPAPTNWRRFSNNLYLVNFHQVDEIWESALLMTKTEPDNAAWHYNLYEAYNLLKKPQKALAALDRAVQIDPGYALEIVNLARARLRNNNYTKGIELLNRAHELTLEQDFIKFDLAIANLQAGNRSKATSIVDELKILPWSPVYFSNMPTTLARIRLEANPPPLRLDINPSDFQVPFHSSE